MDRITLSLGFRTIAIVGLAALLAWQVVSRSLVSFLAKTAPETALRLRSTDPVALVLLADKTLNLRQTPASKALSGSAGQPPTSDTAVDADPEIGDEIRTWSETALKLAGDKFQLRATGDGQATSEKPTSSQASDASSSLPPEMGKKVRIWAETALESDPLNSRALRVLGQIADRDRDELHASKFMEAAARRSIRESLAVHWLMKKSFENHEYAAAVHWADALLRARRDIQEYVLPALVQIAEDKQGSGELTKLLVNAPPWRHWFFSELPGKVSDPSAPLRLLLAIKDTPTPPTVEELRGYMFNLVDNGLHELAYYAWLQFLSPNQLGKVALLYNGGFELEPSGLPFDWVITPITGATVEILPRPDKDDEKALFLEFDYGQVDFRNVSEVILLPPGTYKFKGQYKADIINRRGMSWRIYCAGRDEALIGESPLVTGVTKSWVDFEFSFVVPAAGCRAQQVRLELAARMSSEQIVSGSIWYDELRISREEKIDPAGAR